MSKSGVLAWRAKLRFAQVVFLSFGGALALVVQLFMYPLAGKKVSDNSALYAYQLDTWTNEIYNRLETISRTAPYDELDLTKQRQITPEYINKVASFHAQMLQVLRVLSYQAMTVTRLADEVRTVLGTSGYLLDQNVRQDLLSGMRSLEREAQRQVKIRAEIEQFSKQLRAAYSPDIPQPKTVDASADRIVEQILALKALYSKPELLLTPDANPMLFLQNFGKTQETIFDAYSQLVNEHNRQVENHEFYRDALQVAIAILTACLLLHAEMKANRIGSIKAKKKSTAR